MGSWLWKASVRVARWGVFYHATQFKDGLHARVQRKDHTAKTWHEAHFLCLISVYVVLWGKHALRKNDAILILQNVSLLGTSGSSWCLWFDTQNQNGRLSLYVQAKPAAASQNCKDGFCAKRLLTITLSGDSTVYSWKHHHAWLGLPGFSPSECCQRWWDQAWAVWFPWQCAGWWWRDWWPSHTLLIDFLSLLAWAPWLLPHTPPCSPLSWALHVSSTELCQRSSHQTDILGIAITKGCLRFAVISFMTSLFPD